MEARQLVSALCRTATAPTLLARPALAPLFANHCTRAFSASTQCLADEPQSSWPPQRPAQATSKPTTNAASGETKPVARDPLKDLYASDDPALWSMWSTDDFYKRHAASKPRGPQTKLRSSTGRTVRVGGSVDQARAFNMVESLVRQNRVKNSFYQQRFHERPGLRRKRRAMELWRRRFKDGMFATMRRVEELVRQGW